MKMIRTTAVLILGVIFASPALTAENDSEAFGQFQAVLRGIDQRSFEMVKGAIDQTDLSNRVFSHRPLDEVVRDNFRAKFWELIEAGFMQGLPPQGSNVSGELIQFSFQDGLGRASVRYALPDYEYKFQVFDLRHDRRGRLKIVDWFDTSAGSLFTEQINDELITIMPTKEATRRMLTVKNPTDVQLFQVTEILKAARDGQPPRFFEIYDAFDAPIKREPIVAKRAVRMAYAVQDAERFLNTLEIFVDVYADDPNQALMTAELYLKVQDYAKSFEALRRFQQNFSVKEGALPAKLSALALALGKADDAETFAVEATVNEPALELGWWSLLRARSSAGNFSGATEALTHLEDDFGYRMDEAKLRRDKFRGFATLVASQEFKDWRDERP